MKVGILTFQFAINYGAVLQLYSLQKTLKDMGYETEVINYIPDDFDVTSMRAILRNSGLKSKKDGVKAIAHRVLLNLKNQKKLCASFKEFENKNFKLSKVCNSSNWEEVFKQYDAIVVGSDQVWNPTSQRGRVYFLDSDAIKGKRISYAADSTGAGVDENNKERLCRALNKFDAVSVRNTHSAEFFKNVTGNEAEIVADPVILSSFDEFKSKNDNGKYAFVYLLGKEIPGGHEKIISEVKKKYGDIKIIQAVMIKQNEFVILNEADEKFADCSPEDWVNLIANAEFVFTDSFHCILFSLKFKRNFMAYYSEKNRAPRLLGLQAQYNLGSKIVGSADEAIEKDSLNYQLNYEEIDKVFEAQKKEAIEFLKSNLGE